jgi:hypothetical protein
MFAEQLFPSIRISESMARGHLIASIDAAEMDNAIDLYKQQYAFNSGAVPGAQQTSRAPERQADERVSAVSAPREAPATSAARVERLIPSLAGFWPPGRFFRPAEWLVRDCRDHNGNYRVALDLSFLRKSSAFYDVGLARMNDLQRFVFANAVFELLCRPNLEEEIGNAFLGDVNELRAKPRLFPSLRITSGLGPGCFDIEIDAKEMHDALKMYEQQYPFRNEPVAATPPVVQTGGKAVERAPKKPAPAAKKAAPAAKKAAPAAEKAAPNKCVVCFERSIDRMVMPCNHISTCQTCIASLVASSSVCPICRGPIASVVPVFICAAQDDDE